MAYCDVGSSAVDDCTWVGTSDDGCGAQWRRSYCGGPACREVAFPYLPITGPA